MQSKRTLRFHLILVKMAIKKTNSNKHWQGCWERVAHIHPFFGRSRHWCSHYGNRCGSVSKTPSLELPYDPAISLLGTRPKDSESHHSDPAHPCSLLLWSQQLRNGTSLGINRMGTENAVRIHNGILFNHKEIMAFTRKVG